MADFNTGQFTFTAANSNKPTQINVPTNGAGGYVVLKPVTGNSHVIYVGGASVTASTGYPLASGDEPLRLETMQGNQIWCVGQSGDTLAWAQVDP